MMGIVIMQQENLVHDCLSSRMIILVLLLSSQGFLKNLSQTVLKTYIQIHDAIAHYMCVCALKVTMLFQRGDIKNRTVL